MTGRAMCGSWKTPSNGPRPCAKGTSSRRPICRRACLASVQTPQPGAGCASCRHPARPVRVRPLSPAPELQPAAPDAVPESEPAAGRSRSSRSESSCGSRSRPISTARSSNASGDKEQAALLLGVSIATLYRKLAGDDAASREVASFFVSFSSREASSMSCSVAGVAASDSD